MKRPSNSSHGPSRPRGVGLVELMVSLTLGLVLGAMVLGLLGALARQRVEDATLAAALRHFQAVTERVAREVRRAGHQRSAGARTPGAVSAWSWVDTSRSKATWVYESDASRAPGTAGPLSSDASGVRVSSGALQVQLGSGNWQALNDPALLWVDALDVVPMGPTAAPCPALGAQVSVQARPVLRGVKGPVWSWRSRVAWPAQPGVRRDAVVLCPPQTGEAL